MSGYESRLPAVGVRASGCLERSTSITRSPVSVHRSPSWRTSPCLPFGYPLHRHLELPAEHQAVESFCPVFRRLLPLGDGKLFPTRSQRVFHQNLMLPLLPGVQSLLDTPTDGLGCDDMLVSLQDHRMKEDKPLRVPHSVLYPLKLRPQHPDEPAPDSPTRRVIAPLWHAR